MASTSSRPTPSARYNGGVTSFRVLASDADVDAVLAASQIAPVIVFKHSQSCGVSLMVRDGLSGSELPGPVYEVVVQRHRDVSQRIAALFGVRHESPQAFVVAQGAVTWHSSHNGVTAARITAAWQAATAAFTLTPVASR